MTITDAPIIALRWRGWRRAVEDGFDPRQSYDYWLLPASRISDADVITLTARADGDDA